MPDIPQEVALLIRQQASRPLHDSLKCPHCQHIDTGFDAVLREDNGNHMADFLCRSCREVVVSHPVSRALVEFVQSGRLEAYSMGTA